MITIFKNKNDIPMDMEYVELNDIYFNQNIALMLDEKAKELIEAIDGAKLISRFKICSSFSEIENKEKYEFLRGNKELEMIFEEYLK